MSRNAHSNSKWPMPRIRTEKRPEKEMETHMQVHRDMKLPEPAGMQKRTHRK